jgi:hypothetical protein
MKRCSRGQALGQRGPGRSRKIKANLDEIILKSELIIKDPRARVQGAELMIDLSKRGKLSSGEYDSAMRIHWKNHGLNGNYGPSPPLSLRNQWKRVALKGMGWPSS